MLHIWISVHMKYLGTRMYVFLWHTLIPKNLDFCAVHTMSLINIFINVYTYRRNIIRHKRHYLFSNIL